MYTDGVIWAKMLELKVFRLEDVVKSLNPPKHLYGWVKERVRSLITNQLKLNILHLVVENPPIYATENASPEDIENYRKWCLVCGRKFFPSQDKQEFCSAQCKKAHYKRYHRKRRQKLGMKVGSKRRWTEEELKLLEPLLYRKAEKGELDNIARRLGRGKWAVSEKLKSLRRLRHEIREHSKKA